MRVRSATPDDIRAWHGRDIPEGWCIAQPIGYVAERDGVAVAIGIVSWDVYGRAWGFFSANERLPVTMHRKAKDMLRLLRSVGEPALYAGCSPTIDGAEEWLRRLGFAPVPELTAPDFAVWRCDLST